MKELTYINGGQLYKESTKRRIVPGKICISSANSNKGIESDYYHDIHPSNKYDRIFHFKSIKRDSTGEWVKTYESTKQLRELLGVSGGVELPDLTLSSDVSLWLAVGSIEGNSNFVELYFNVESNEQLSAVASFYNLDNPIDLNNDLDTNRSEWEFRTFTSKLLAPPLVAVAGAIAFEDGVAKLLKIYKSNVPS